MPSGRLSPDPGPNQRSRRKAAKRRLSSAPSSDGGVKSAVGAARTGSSRRLCQRCPRPSEDQRILGWTEARHRSATRLGRSTASGTPGSAATPGWSRPTGCAGSPGFPFPRGITSSVGLRGMEPLRPADQSGLAARLRSAGGLLRRMVPADGFGIFTGAPRPRCGITSTVGRGSLPGVARNKTSTCWTSRSAPPTLPRLSFEGPQALTPAPGSDGSAAGRASHSAPA